MLDLALAGFMMGFLALGLRRPFLWILAYLYVDILAPQKISYFLLASVPLSLIVFVGAFAAWLLADDKKDSRFTLRQALMLLLLLYCGYTTLGADFPKEAADKWSWVWKALIFAIFLPLTLRTRLRIESAIMVMVLSVAGIIISGSIKTIITGGGYGELKLFVNNNTGIYESSIISCAAVAIIPLIVWLTKHSTIFPMEWRSKLFAVALSFACLLIPIGTQARTGLICIGVLALLSLRTIKRRMLYVSLMGAAAMIAIPLLPASFTARMSTIENHASDQSASSRLAIWAWTWDYAKDNPFGGGFDAYLSNRIKVEITDAERSGASTEVDSTVISDKSRAYHSSYFEMLGEQGWPGTIIWLWMHALGVWQMERLRRRWRGRTGPGETWQAPLASALQQAQIIYLVGSLFVGIAYQPFFLLIVALQCGLWSYLQRHEQENRPRLAKFRKTQPARPAGAPASQAR